MIAIDRQNTIYTIGHSNHTFEFFAELLKAFEINCVVDVRSVPVSAYSPQFNQDILLLKFKPLGIKYLHFKKEFGARQTDAALLDEDGKVDFEKVRRSEPFLQGVGRLQAGIKAGHRIALMCSEADPFECHRFSMISCYLAHHGLHVQHILKDKTTISNEVLEKELIKKYQKKIPQPTLFEPAALTPEEVLSLTYKLRNKDIAYADTELLP